MKTSTPQIGALIASIHANTATSVSFEGHKLTYNDVAFLAPQLMRNTSLTTLDLSSSNIPDSGVNMISAALKFNTTLQVLILRNNGLSTKCGDGLRELALNNNTLLDIDLSGNPLISNGLQNELEGILSSNRSGAAAAAPAPAASAAAAPAPAAAASAASSPAPIRPTPRRPVMAITIAPQPSNAHVKLALDEITAGRTKISFFGKTVTDDDAALLAKALTINPKITALDLQGAHISYAGLLRVTDELKHSRTLTTLDLRNNNLSEECGGILWALLGNPQLPLNKTLIEVKLEGNDAITDDIKTYLTNMVEDNRANAANTPAAAPAAAPVKPIPTEMDRQRAIAQSIRPPVIPRTPAVQQLLLERARAKVNGNER